MKQHWTKEELETVWRIWPNEEPLIQNKRGSTRLGYAVFLKYFQYEGRFPSNITEVPFVLVAHVGKQVGVETEVWSEYPWQGRSAKYHRASIRAFCAFREATMDDEQKLEDWLAQEVLMREQIPERAQECAFNYCRQRSIEPPGPERLKRIIINAVNRQETLFCESFFQQLSPSTVEGLEALLLTSTRKSSIGFSIVPAWMANTRSAPWRARLRRVWGSSPRFCPRPLW